MREKYGEKQKGKIMDLGGGQADNWMVVSIQASISGSIRQFLQIYACFDCVVISHQKGRDCNEHGTIYVISSDFGDRMTTQHLD